MYPLRTGSNRYPNTSTLWKIGMIYRCKRTAKSRTFEMKSVRKKDRPRHRCVIHDSNNHDGRSEDTGGQRSTIENVHPNYLLNPYYASQPRDEQTAEDGLGVRGEPSCDGPASPNHLVGASEEPRCYRLPGPGKPATQPPLSP